MSIDYRSENDEDEEYRLLIEVKVNVRKDFRLTGEIRAGGWDLDRRTGDFSW
jgi:hypothetical protein